jgi:hypothetical protein
MSYKELGSRLKQSIQSKVDKLKDGAPESLDTFKETAEAISSIKRYQKYINADLDYGIFEPVARSSTFVACASVKYGNLSIDEDGYIILNANKKYNVYVDLYNTVTTTGMWLVDKNNNQVSVGKSTGSLGFLNIETSEETHVAIKFNLGASLETEWCGIIVQEVGRAIVIDQIEHVDATHGIEDTPVGHIITHIGIKAPKHYLVCDGSEYKIEDYPYLAQHIEDEFGSVNYFGGDGETTFGIPEIETKDIDITPIMTGNNSPSPYVTSASSINADQQPYKTFNGKADSPSDCWAASTVQSWLKIDFGKGVSVSKFAVTGIHTNTQYNPKDFILYGSNDDVTYVPLYEATNQINWTSKEYREYSLGKTVHYRYFKFDISNNNGAAYSALSLLHFYQHQSNISCIKYEPTYFLANNDNKFNYNYFNPALYSEEEKVIGCWINGKPLYQKTFITKVPMASTQIALNLADLNVDNIVNFISSFSNNEIINVSPNTSGDNYLNFWYNKTAKLLHIACTEEKWSGWDLYITSQYTKTVDEENSFNEDVLDYIEAPSVTIDDYSHEEVTNAINALW